MICFFCQKHCARWVSGFKNLFHGAAVMAPLAPKFLRVREQESGFVQTLGLVALVLAGGSSQRALALQAELHCNRICREGVLWLSLRASSARDTSHGHHLWTQPGSTEEMCSACTSWHPGAGTGTARLCCTPGELGQFPSPYSALPLLSKANHPQNNEPSLAHTALRQHETSLPDKGEKPERTRM